MIKRHANLLLLVTAVFAAFTLGFFMGRNYNPSPVQVSPLQPAETSNHTQLILQAPQTEAAETANAAVSATLPTEPPDSLSQETTAATEPAVPTESVPKATEPAGSGNTQTQEPKETAPTVESTSSTEVAETTKPSEEATVPATTEAAKSGLININTASAAELMTLPGIGEVLSQRIVAYREANGPFPSVAALTNVSGIGEKRLAAIIHLITV